MNSRSNATLPDRDLIGLMVLAFGVALILRLCCFDVAITEGSSMIPTIPPGKIIVINRLAYGFRFPWQHHYLVRWSTPQPGDIVVLLSPQGRIAVKRCITLIGNESLFVEGDNTTISYDSRHYGPVPIDFITGKVVGIR
ncbi:MAG: S26 family signal peptidase [Treponemataceae bacterium]|nr:S26 family signal peptidase [Treponemataceae bacterium]